MPRSARSVDVRKAGFAAVLCLPLLAGLTASHAADLGAAEQPPALLSSTEGWIITLKANGSFSTEWAGSKSYDPQGYPSFSFRRASEPATWSAPDDGFGIPVYENRFFNIGPVARYDSGRYRSDDQKLFGIRDVVWTFEPGIYAEFWPIPDILRARIELRHGFVSNGGFLADASVDYLWHVGQTTFAIGPRLGANDEDTMRREFGVKLIDATQNGIVTPYTPNGGFRSAGLATSVTYDMSDTWSTTIYGGYDRLIGDAAKSPLIRKLGSPDQFRAGLSVSYSFGFKGL
jgi:outer membrane scaffolding protein for murein synthesis (MipA/OmpV family)